MWQLNKQHWRIWHDFHDFQEAARALAAATGYPILTRPWNGGWVIFNLRNLFDLAAEREADDIGGEQSQNHCEEYDEVSEALTELGDDFARSSEEGWFYGD